MDINTLNSLNTSSYFGSSSVESLDSISYEQYGHNCTLKIRIHYLSSSDCSIGHRNSSCSSCLSECSRSIRCNHPTFHSCLYFHNRPHSLYLLIRFPNCSVTVVIVHLRSSIRSCSTFWKTRPTFSSVFVQLKTLFMIWMDRQSTLNISTLLSSFASSTVPNG